PDPPHERLRTVDQFTARRLAPTLDIASLRASPPPRGYPWYRRRRTRIGAYGRALSLPAVHDRQAGRGRAPPAGAIAGSQNAATPAARQLPGRNPRPRLRDRISRRLFDR